METTHKSSGSRATAIAQGLLVVFLWATSWVLIKIGLHEIPPVVFAGLRYTLAFLCLLAVLLLGNSRKELAALPRAMWGRLILLGLLLYAVTQGTAFVVLSYLPAVTVNLLWSFSTVTITLLGVVWLSERPTALQVGGILLALLGALIYFYPAAIPAAQLIGVGLAIIGILTNAVAAIMGRDINRSRQYSAFHVTVVSMGAGAIALLAAGLLLEGMPTISPQGWAIIAWLAIVNTAFAFTLWNHTLRTLTAMESSIINSTMMIWIPILAVIFLGETITAPQLLGLVLGGLGVLIVQLRRLPAPWNNRAP
jgi:drug/metabolite transporter (DMT)-like permease